MKRSNQRRAKDILARIEKDNDFKRIVVFRDSMFVSKEFYESLRFLVGELGWNTLMETKEFKSLSRLIIALANEVRERKRLEKFVKVSKQAKKGNEQDVVQIQQEVRADNAENKKA